MDLKDKKVTIFGLGKSGLAVARKLALLGARVLATEAKLALDPEVTNELRRLGVELELGGHTDRSVTGASLIVVSPGIHLDLPVLVKARDIGVPIISELELAYRFLTRPIIAITGTNGKTTTTTLIGEMLKAAGKRVFVGGNIGQPLVDLDDSDLDYIVAEVSSYQLESSETFHPKISVILNIQPDHIERHHTMASYIKEKQKIFRNQAGDDYLVYNLDDKEVVKMVSGARCQRLGFSKAKANEIITIQPDEIKMPGRHNLENALAAAQAAYLCGVSKEIVAEVLRTFPGVEHRIEFTISRHGVDFYNDSKGTNPDSTLVAIETFAGKKKMVLILGGRDKGTDLVPLVAQIKAFVKEVVLVGEATERFAAALNSAGFTNVQRAGFSLEEAVNLAYLAATPGEVVLFSPACASFDLFNNYEERGRVFKELCRKLKD